MAVGTVTIRRTANGFSLIELSVVLGVIALVMSAGLVMVADTREKQRYQTTLKKMDFIMRAIDDFVDQYGYIPCPANGAALFDAPDFGFGVWNLPGDDPLVDVTTCNALNRDSSISGSEAGTVPVYSLRIPPEYALDGWNRRFSYVVEEELTYVGGPGLGGFADPASVGDLEILNYGNTQFDAEPGGTIRGAVLIISYGPNGLFAWPGRGGNRLPGAGADPQEVENNTGDNDDDWHEAPLWGNQADNTYFDDIVDYRTKWQLSGAE